MKRKILSIVICIMLALSLCACQSKESNNDASDKIEEEFGIDIAED